MAVYGPRVNVHDDRKGAFRNTANILWLVVHTSEQSGETTGTAEALARYMETAGDRAGGYGSSYHAITDTDRILPCVPDNVVAFAASGGNAQGLHVCIPGKAAQTAAQWNDEITGAFLEQCAQWLADKATVYGIPLRKLNSNDVRAGLRGVCGHVEVSQAFKKSTHTDPGNNFPWTAVLARANQIAAPPPPPPAPVPDGAPVLRAHGWYRVRDGESPWSIAQKIWGSGLLNPALTARNPGVWHPDQFIEIPDLPTVILTAQAGDGPYSLLRKAFPGEDPGKRLEAFFAFNNDRGRSRTLKPNDVVSIPVFWTPR